MTARSILGSRWAGLARTWRRYRTNTSGLAAVEFALVLPIMLTLWIGGVEVTLLLSLDRRVNNMTAMIADLAARERCLTTTGANEMLELADGALHPYDTAPLGVVLTALEVDEDGDVTVDWSHSHGSVPARPVDDDDQDAAIDAIVDDALEVPNSQIIMAEGYYIYNPGIGYVLTGSFNLTKRSFNVPRLVDRLEAPGASCT